jgi:hypothetical protein
MTHAQTRPQRTTYQTARVRPTSLVGNRDVALIDGDWREVLDVYTYADVDELLRMYAHDEEATKRIKLHLADDTDELYAIVRYLVEVPGAGELTTPISVFRRCELVIVQDPEPADDTDPIAEVLAELHGEVGSDGEVDLLTELSVRAGLVWACRTETCTGRHNTRNQDTCAECGTPRSAAAES